MPTPDFQVATNNGVIAVSGRLDFTTATQVLGAVNEHMSASPSGINGKQVADSDQPIAHAQVIDLAAVTHCNSAGLALMIEWLAEAQRTGRNIRFDNIPDSLRQISTVCQVDSLI